MASESEKRETIADIVAEMRDATMNGEYDDTTVNDWADRIEASVARERESWELAAANAVRVAQQGNAAAMRTCLMNILAEMIDLGGMEVGRKVKFSPDAIANEIRAALAAPPRNCDMYATHDEAMKARGHRIKNFGQWLFDPADEGGAK